MTKLLVPDICVVGAGAGGMAVATAAAALGVEVVLVERARMGGARLYGGALPMHALAAVARRAWEARGSGELGVVAGDVRVDFARAMDHVRASVAAGLVGDTTERMAALGVKVIGAEARFIDARTLEAGAVRVRARRFVVATGAAPIVPPLPGLAEIPHLTTDTVFELTELPARLVVLGAGAIGLGFAQIFRRLGSEVTVIDAGPPLADIDPELAGEVVAALEREGVEMLTGVAPERVEPVAGGLLRVAFTAEGIERGVQASHLLVAAGRRPNIEGLGLERAGVRPGPGGVKVDGHFRTRNSRIHVIGDALGGPQSVHGAVAAAGEVVRHALFRLPARGTEHLVARVVPTSPALAAVGLDEARARRKAGTIRVLRWPFAETDAARAEGRPHGHLKIITDAQGRVLGGGVVGEAALELAVPLALAAAKRLTADDLAALAVPYPALSEALARAAQGFRTRSLTKPWVQRIIHMVRRMG